MGHVDGGSGLDASVGFRMAKFAGDGSVFLVVYVAYIWVQIYGFGCVFDVSS